MQYQAKVIIELKAGMLDPEATTTEKGLLDILAMMSVV